MASPFLQPSPAVPATPNIGQQVLRSPFANMFGSKSQSARLNPGFKGLFGINGQSTYHPPTGLTNPGGPANVATTDSGQQGMTENDAATGLIQGDPDLSAILAQYGADSQADAASRDEAIRRILVSYGVMPDISGMDATSQGFLKSAVNDQVRALMAKNEAEGTSVHARMQHANQLAQRGIGKELAGRGALHSGETGFQLREQAQGAKNEQFDTLNELLGNIQGAGSQFANAERERAMAIAQAQMQAAWQRSQMYGDSNLGADSGTSNPSVTPTATVPGVKPPPKGKPPKGFKPTKNKSSGNPMHSKGKGVTGYPKPKKPKLPRGV